MTDVLKIALDRRAELHEELTKLDDFIRMAEALIRGSQLRKVDTANEDTPMPQRPARVPEPVIRTQPRRAEAESEAAAASGSRPQVIRRAPTASGA